jgi:hypothetical protein
MKSSSQKDDNKSGFEDLCTTGIIVDIDKFDQNTTNWLWAERFTTEQRSKKHDQKEQSEGKKETRS